MSQGTALTSAQQVGLVLLRTLVGWHFLYEGYFKLWRPVGPDGGPSGLYRGGLPEGGLGSFARSSALAETAWIGTIDVMVARAARSASRSCRLSRAGGPGRARAAHPSTGRDTGGLPQQARGRYSS